MISKCFNYETDAARALAKGDNVLRISQYHPFKRANIYILRESENQYALFQHEVITPPRKLTSLGYKKNTIYIRQVL